MGSTSVGPFFVLEKRTCFVFLGTTPVNAFKIPTAFITPSTFTSRLLKRSPLNLLIIQKAAVEEIPDDAPSSLSGMTPFDFRVIARHPQERVGDLLFPLTSQHLRPRTSKRKRSIGRSVPSYSHPSGIKKPPIKAA
ncbi:hypothetical protein THOB06_270023 [Vibrio rotiferianus]|nr:hypothetical protein THOG10_270022 [Vibrio rotiferianus]CAH1579722.1 hypothetical protein THOB06_270023 [Vibrio rotiferianus]